MATVKIGNGEYILGEEIYIYPEKDEIDYLKNQLQLVINMADLTKVAAIYGHVHPAVEAVYNLRAAYAALRDK